MTIRNLALSALLTLLTASGACATAFGTIPMRETPPVPKETQKEPPKDATKAPAKPVPPGTGAPTRAQKSPPAPSKGARKGGPPNICERELARASRKYNVPLQILYAVGLTESGYGGFLQPYTLYIEGKDYISNNLQDALKLFRAANARGVQLIDIGCMQVNYYWHKEEFNNLEEMFNPRLNVEQAARFLQELRKRHGSWTMALARYNAGPKNTVAQHRYVCRVMKNLVEAGVGQWTASAKSFCDTPPPKPEEAPAQAASAQTSQPPATPAEAQPAEVSPAGATAPAEIINPTSLH